VSRTLQTIETSTPRSAPLRGVEGWDSLRFGPTCSAQTRLSRPLNRQSPRVNAYTDMSEALFVCLLKTGFWWMS